MLQQQKEKAIPHLSTIHLAIVSHFAKRTTELTKGRLSKFFIRLFIVIASVDQTVSCLGQEPMPCSFDVANI